MGGRESGREREGVGEGLRKRATKFGTPQTLCALNSPAVTVMHLETVTGVPGGAHAATCQNAVTEMMGQPAVPSHPSPCSLIA